MTDNQLAGYTIGLIASLATLALLKFGAPLLVPLVVAIVIWFVIKALARQLITMGVPRTLASILAAIVILTTSLTVLAIVAANIAGVVQIYPRYASSVNTIITNLTAAIPADIDISLPDLVGSPRVLSALQSMAGSIVTYIGNLGLILAYVLFLFLSEQTLARRLVIAIPDKRRRRFTIMIAERIQREIRSYLWAKTLMNIMTGIVCGAALLLMGVDYPLFWAFWIFMLNYVPYIGSILGAVLPALLAYVQFGSGETALLVLVILGVAQAAIDNVVEPQFMGRTLNLDPVVIMIALILWGSLWGMAGIFLAIPLTAMLVIILAWIPDTRWLAVMMSRTGEVGPQTLTPAR